MAFKKRAFQSSASADESASRAVDNDLNTAACTDYTLQQWWAVDLGAPMDVARVTVSNDMAIFKDDKEGKLAFSATTMSTTINMVSSVTILRVLNVVELSDYSRHVSWDCPLSQNFAKYGILKYFPAVEK